MNPNPPPTLKTAAFSLVELLAVVAVLAVLGSMAVPGLQSILKGRALRTASEQAWGAVSMARQEAISRQANVAVVLTTGRSSGSSEKSDALMLLVASPSASGWTWTPCSKWIKLPSGVEAKPEAGSYLSSATSTPSVAAYAGIASALSKIDGETVTNFTYVVFRPDGSVDSATANPVLGFRRWNSPATTTETALV
jgi:prepilin-type N-terminal cleavage/methylation domain-containing protein